jgi:hypothetical protein
MRLKQSQVLVRETNMNFQDLISKMTALDQPVAESVQPPVQAIGATPSGPATPEQTGDSGHLSLEEQPAEECGMPGMIKIGGQSDQPDNVTMNVSMNGSGAGGIRDLMDILRNLEKGDEHDGEKLFGMESDQAVIEPAGEVEPNFTGEPRFDDVEDHEKLFGEVDVEEDGEYKNRPYPVVRGASAVLPTGNDMHSKGLGALKHNGGENPMHEGLVKKLSQMYEEIKGR